MRHAVRAACLARSLLWVQAAVAEPSVRDRAARTEVHPIQTLTVSVRQFLTGDQDGEPVTIARHLRFPTAVVGRLPAVTCNMAVPAPMHATNSEQKLSTRWGSRLFGGQLLRAQLGSYLDESGQFNSYSVIPDAHRAFNVLANHSRIDPTQIAIMGFRIAVKHFVVTLFKLER